MSTWQEKTKARFNGKILGVRAYKSDKSRFTVDDFLDLDTLIDFLWELDTCECCITPAGKSFLEEYYGLDTLAKELVANGHTLMPYGASQQDFTAWLRSLNPNGVEPPSNKNEVMLHQSDNQSNADKKY